MEKVIKIVNGIEVKISKDDESIFNTLIKNSSDLETEVATLKAEIVNHKATIVKKDEELKSAQVSDEQIAKLVNEKAEVVKVAKLLFSEVDESKSTNQIKIDTINSVNGDLIKKDASVEIVNAVFSTLSKTGSSESEDAAVKVQNAINQGDNGKPGDAKVLNAREERTARRKKNFQKNFK